MKYFKTQELIAKEIYDILGERSIHLINPKMIMGLEMIRKYFNAPITVNTWIWGGDLNYRGLRPYDCKMGAKRSWHKLGMAIDFDVKGFSAKEIRTEMITNYKKFPFITRLENNVNWVHMDMKPTNQKGIILFNP